MNVFKREKTIKQQTIHCIGPVTTDQKPAAQKSEFPAENYWERKSNRSEKLWRKSQS